MTETCLPMSAHRAKSIGLIDEVFRGTAAVFHERVAWAAEALVASADMAARVPLKRAARLHDESIRPLEAYRYEELAKIGRDFSSSAYQQARQAFVLKHPREPFTHPSAIGPVILPAAAVAPAIELDDTGTAARSVTG
jgi:putative two-component system hydrogenase maturation factor HypX/HoxX